MSRMEMTLALAPIFADGMVLQREKPIAIFGRGRPGAGVRATLCGRSAETVCGEAGWKLYLPPMPAAEGCELAVRSEGEEIVVADVAIGEVWLAGGQSNMEMPLRQDAEFARCLALPPNGSIRFFDVPRTSYPGQEKDADFSPYGFWRKSTPRDRPWFSAAAFYFSALLWAHLRVPIGVVGCNYGGTSASCWVHEADLQADAALNAIYLESYKKGLEKLDIPKYEADYKRVQRMLQTPAARQFADTITTRRLSFPQTLWGIARRAKKQGVSLRTYFSAQAAGPLGPNRPAALYHSMLLGVAPYTLRGVLWYQGEADDTHAPQYARLFGAVIGRWRHLWGEELPFLFVQLAPFGSWTVGDGRHFPALRHQQDTVAKTVPNAFMASVMDSGDKKSIHPLHKRPVGERLALLALGKVYGEDVLCDAPEGYAAAATKTGLTVKFRHAGAGLAIGGKALHGLQLFDARGREIKKWAATARGSLLYVACKRPAHEVRFAWQGYVEANLYGSGGLCAKPFRLKVQAPKDTGPR